MNLPGASLGVFGRLFAFFRFAFSVIEGRKIALVGFLFQGVPTNKVKVTEYSPPSSALFFFEVVVVEVKTTLRLKDVNHFIKKLQDFKNIFHEYADKKILGAVAYLKANEGAARDGRELRPPLRVAPERDAEARTAKYSEKKGFFVIRVTGSSASITNPVNFKPKVF